MTTTPSHVTTLTDLYRYNRWANTRVFAACTDVDALSLREDARGTFGTIEATLKHLVGVEDVYLLMSKGLLPDRSSSREAYTAHDLAWFAERARTVGDGYLDLLTTQDEAFLERALTVPWFDLPLTVHDGLLQVLNHSAQHRAQVLSWLGDRGLPVPNIDYVFMLGETRSHTRLT